MGRCGSWKAINLGAPGFLPQPLPVLLLLIRHGDTPVTGKTLAGRAPGVHLNEAGTRQAAAVAERLTGLAVQAVYASPLERTMETAAPLAASKALRIEA